MLKLPIYELILADLDSVEIALVDSPATEEEFIFFNEEIVNIQFNEDKMIVTGPVLIPNQKIFRNDMLGQRYVFMSKDTIHKFAEQFIAKKDNKFNLKHSDYNIELTVLESYFAKEGNEFNVPEGSWILSAKVNDSDIWNKIKTGDLKGYSMEALFENHLVQFEQQKEKEKMSDLKAKFLNFINEVLFTEEPIVVPEPIVETPVVVEPIIAPEVIVEPVIDEAASKREQLINDLVNELTLTRGELKELREKVDAYSNQPITPSLVKEKVSNLQIPKESKAAEFFVRE
jgi:hypothetical protein